jgi:hypothetical protein
MLGFLEWSCLSIQFLSFCQQSSTRWAIRLRLPSCMSISSDPLRLIARKSHMLFFRMTIPPYAAGCITTVVVGMLSDRYSARGPFIMVLSFTAIVGYIMLYTTSPARLPGVGYAGSILVTCGVFPTVPIMLAWGSNNAGSSLKKAVIIGLLSGVGNLGG